MKHGEPSLSWARGMFQGARNIRLSLTGRERNVPSRRRSARHIQRETWASKTPPGFVAVPRHCSCSLELLLGPKWCISKFLSKGLFFYYLLNFQTFSNFGGKKRKHMRNFQQSCLAFLCVMNGSLTKKFCYLTDTIPLPQSTRWENEEISLSNLFTCIFFRTSFYGNTSLFVMQYSFSVFDRGGEDRGIQNV